MTLTGRGEAATRWARGDLRKAATRRLQSPVQVAGMREAAAAADAVIPPVPPGPIPDPGEGHCVQA